MASPRVSKPTFEHHHSGLGIGHASPRVSWQFLASKDTAQNWIQTAYELRVTGPDAEAFETFKVDSSGSVLVPWPAQPLRSRQSVIVQVRCFGKASDAQGVSQATEWSEPAPVEAGLLEKADWTACFIAPSKQQDSRNTLRPVKLWKSFTLPNSNSGFLRARIYTTALGVLEVMINGQLVSNECLAPGWTSYKHRLVYRTLDVGQLLKPNAENTICIHVAEGWYAGRLGFKGGKRFWYGDQIAALAQLEVHSDGELWTLGTDDSWVCSQSALLSSGIYDGEVFDDREEGELAVIPKPSQGVQVLAWPKSRIVASDTPPVRVTETRNIYKKITTPSGKTVLDFGQNMVGKLLVKSLPLAEGSEVTFKHAEVLEHGELGIRPLRLAKATDVIIGSGRQIVDWTPKFSFHGFRYVQVEGWPSDAPSLEEAVTALVMHSDMKRRGTFQCSNHYVNRLHENVVWSTKGNFLSIPTDCPQRDERLGWTGDIQVFSPTASFLYDTSGFLGSWLEDVSDEQLEEGRGGVPPLVVPDVIPPNWPRMPQAVWDDVTVLTPYDLYQASGDKVLLEKQFTSMQAWLDHGIDRGPDRLWNFDRWQLSDWLDPSAPPEDPGNGRTDGVVVADAYLIHITEVMSQICGILCKDEMAAIYSKDAADLKAKFQYKYISPAGNLMSSTQTAIALAVQFGLYTSFEHHETAAAQLNKLVRMARFHIATGFAGTPMITHALTSLGQPQLAYRMLLEKTCPSWLYPVTMGATTIWERWNSMLPDGTINPGQMTSFNHYALGAVANWLHSTVAGISPLEAGWKVIKAKPIPGGNLTSAEASFDGPYGLVKCSWTWEPANGRFEMKLTVPPNSTAVVTLPSAWQAAQKSSSTEVSTEVSSGEHMFIDTFTADAWPPQPIVASNQPMPEAEIAT